MPRERSKNSKRRRREESSSRDLDEATSTGKCQATEVSNQSFVTEYETFRGEYDLAKITAGCRSALFDTPAACRAAHAKHRNTIDSNLAKALKAIGGYNKVKDEAYCPLRESVKKGDAATAQSLLEAGADVGADYFKNQYYMLPLKEANDSKCRALLEHHAASLEVLEEDPQALLSAVQAHWAALSTNASEALTPMVALSLRPYHFDPSFLWAPHAARNAVISWARNVYTVQQATTNQLFAEISDDCSGDVLEYLEMSMPRIESLKVAAHGSSPETRAWVRAIVASAVVTKTIVDLETAVEENDLAAIQKYLIKDVDIDTRLMDGRTMLTFASHFGHAAAVTFLLTSGADKEAKDYYGYTALIAATEQNHIASVELLVEAGVEKEATNENGHTALMVASYEGHTAIIQILLRAGAEIDTKDTDDGCTAFLLAADFADSATMEVLLGAGADKDAKDEHGHTALIKATAGDSTDNINLLLQLGTDIEEKDKRGSTALLHASSHGSYDSVEMLLQAGAERDVQDVVGKTALMWASDHGETDVVELLLEAGANKTIQDKGKDLDCVPALCLAIKDGKTALDWANKKGRTEVAALFQ